MIDKAKIGWTTLIFILILSSCNTLTPSSQTATLTPIVVNTLNIGFPSPVPSLTRPPTSTAMPNTAIPVFTPTETFTPAPIYTASPTLQSPPSRNPAMEFPKNLDLDEWVLTEGSSLDRNSFTPILGTREQILERYQNQQDVFDIFPSPLIPGYYNKVMLNAQELAVQEKITDSKSVIRVIHNGSEITQIDAGYFVPPKSNIWGLWTYEDIWILEYITGFEDANGASYQLGNILWDGESLNSKFNYQESFGFTAIDGRIFYFFRRDNQIGISYDGTEYDLDYDTVQHYRFCEWCFYENPHGLGTGWQLNQNLSFFAERDGTKYFVVIWAN